MKIWIGLVIFIVIFIGIYLLYLVTRIDVIREGGRRGPPNAGYAGRGGGTTTNNESIFIINTSGNAKYNVNGLTIKPSTLIYYDIDTTRIIPSSTITTTTSFDCPYSYAVGSGTYLYDPNKESEKDVRNTVQNNANTQAQSNADTDKGQKCVTDPTYTQTAQNQADIQGWADIINQIETKYIDPAIINMNAVLQAYNNSPSETTASALVTSTRLVDKYVNIYNGAVAKYKQLNPKDTKYDNKYNEVSQSGKADKAMNAEGAVTRYGNITGSASQPLAIQLNPDTNMSVIPVDGGPSIKPYDVSVSKETSCSYSYAYTSDVIRKNSHMITNEASAKQFADEQAGKVASADTDRGICKSKEQYKTDLNSTQLQANKMVWISIINQIRTILVPAIANMETAKDAYNKNKTVETSTNWQNIAIFVDYYIDRYKDTVTKYKQLSPDDIQYDSIYNGVSQKAEADSAKLEAVTSAETKAATKAFTFGKLTGNASYTVTVPVQPQSLVYYDIDTNNQLIPNSTILTSAQFACPYSSDYTPPKTYEYDSRKESESAVRQRIAPVVQSLADTYVQTLADNDKGKQCEKNPLYTASAQNDANAQGWADIINQIGTKYIDPAIINMQNANGVYQANKTVETASSWIKTSSLVDSYISMYKEAVDEYKQLGANDTQYDNRYNGVSQSVDAQAALNEAKEGSWVFEDTMPGTSNPIQSVPSVSTQPIQSVPSVSTQPIQSTTSSNKKCTFNKGVPGKCMRGSSLQATNNSDACKKACGKNCQGYNWNNSKKSCILNKYACDASYPIKNDKAYSYYSKTCV